MQATALAVSCLALCQGATANEPVDALANSDAARLATLSAFASPRLVKSKELDMLRATARKTHADRSQTKTTLQPLAIKRGSTAAMIEKMIELDALPFVRVSDKDSSHRVYFGISFDGVLGLHGNF